MEENKKRLKEIMKTSIIAIIVNALLAAFKVIIGLISNSISIMLDGVNNLSDAGSSFITILGATLAAKPADKKHPFGYGRMEYLSSLTISAIVLYAGITSAVESVKKIIEPEVADYSTITLIIIIVAIFAKLILSFYMQKQGAKTNSDSLVASGKEAIMDVIVSVATLVAAVIYIIFGLALEAFLGLIIAVLIIKTGIELLKETISKIIGEPSDIQTVIDVKNTIKSFEEVSGAFDLIMNDYGPDNYTGSVHIEVKDTMTVVKLDELIRNITEKVYQEHRVYLSAISIYAKNTLDDRIKEEEKKIRNIILNREYILGMHGLYINFDTKKMNFDMVVSLDAKDRRAVYTETINAVQEMYPEYDIRAGFDMDFNEINNTRK